MSFIFADTSAWVALLDHKDRNYQAANNFFCFQSLNQPFLTTNFIVSETITAVRFKLRHTPAVEIAEELYAEKFTKLFRVTPEVEAEALMLFKKYADKTFSFTDCISFVVMRNFGIAQAFTFDKHFRQMGFQAVP